MATTYDKSTDGGSFLSGLSDIFGSVLDKAPGIIAATKAKPAAPASPVTPAYDAYGRLPGQPGYGTMTAPTGVQPASMFAANPWLKPVLIGGGALLAVLILIRSFSKK